MDDAEAKAEAIRRRQIAGLRDAYEKIAAQQVPDPMGGHFQTVLAALIMMLETRWDERAQQAFAARNKS